MAKLAAGHPLVRWQRAPGPGWSFLCPLPSCQLWSTSWRTEAACHRAWGDHAFKTHQWLGAGWPDTSTVAVPRSWAHTRGAAA